MGGGFASLLRCPTCTPWNHRTKKGSGGVRLLSSHEQGEVGETLGEVRFTGGSPRRLCLAPLSSHAGKVDQGREVSRRGRPPPGRSPPAPRSRPQPLPPRFCIPRSALSERLASAHFCTGTIDNFICLKCLIYMHIYFVRKNYVLNSCCRVPLKKKSLPVEYIF